MTYDYPELLEQISLAVGAEGEFADRSGQLIDYCSSAIPHKGWEALRQLDYREDIPAVETWLTTALADAEDDVVGLWFGLNNPVVNDQPTADIYVASSENFDTRDMEWTENLSFYSTGYLESAVLGRIYELAYADGGLGNSAEYPLALTYGGMVARLALEASRIASLPRLRGAAVGFDSGDLLTLGTVADGRFRTKIVVV